MISVSDKDIKKYDTCSTTFSTNPDFGRTLTKKRGILWENVGK